MTPPREPDRYEAKAKELCLTEWRPIAAALRQAADEALDEVRQYVDAMPVCTRAGVLRLLDDLQAPAGPAAETEPLLPRVLAVVNADAKHSGDPALIYLAAELRAYIAEREPAEKRIAELEKERDEWRSGYITASVTGRFPLSSHDNNPEIRALRELAEAAFHGQAYAEKARQLRDAEAILNECEDALRAAKNADNAWFSGAFHDRLDRVIRKLAARAAKAKGEGT